MLFWIGYTTSFNLNFVTPLTARKVSKYGVISGLYFPAFELNTVRYFVFSPNAGKYGPEKISQCLLSADASYKDFEFCEEKMVSLLGIIHDFLGENVGSGDGVVSCFVS